MGSKGERQFVLKVAGMTCGHCVARVKRVLEGTTGVIASAVDLDSGMAEIRTDSGVDVGALVAVVEEAGYKASPTQS